MVSNEHTAVGVVSVFKVESARPSTTRVDHQVLLLARPILPKFSAILGDFDIVDGAHAAIE